MYQRNRLNKFSFWLVALLVFCQYESFCQVKMFEEGIISGNDVFSIAFSKDEKQLFFVKAFGGRKKMHIMTSCKRNGKWTIPELFLKDTAQRNIDPFVSWDGLTLYFNSDKQQNDTIKTKLFHIWKMMKTNDGWLKPEYYTKINSDSADYFLTQDIKGNSYFSSTRPYGFGKTDIWTAKFENGEFANIENPGSIINSSDHETNPFIDPKGKYLIFVKNDTVSKTDSDLFISFRLANGSWSKAVKLAPEINSDLAEFAPYVSRNGKILYFTRMKRGAILIENIYYYQGFHKLINKLKRKV